MSLDTAYLSALAALAGSAIGGLTSLAASWMSLQTQTRAQQRAYDRARRGEIYRDFIVEASRLHGDSLVHDKAEVQQLVAMYALISRMRVLSSPAVVQTAEQVAREIVETYSAPNRTFPELSEMIAKGQNLDLLRRFAEVCREEQEPHLAMPEHGSAEPPLRREALAYARASAKGG